MALFRRLFGNPELIALNLDRARSVPRRSVPEESGGWYRSDIAEGMPIRFAMGSAYPKRSTRRVAECGSLSEYGALEMPLRGSTCRV
jgi:hypothetical protein